MDKNDDVFRMGKESALTAIGRTIVALYVAPTSETYAVLDDGRLLVCGSHAHVYDRKTSESEMRYHVRWADIIMEAHSAMQTAKAANEATTNTQKGATNE